LFFVFVIFISLFFYVYTGFVNFGLKFTKTKT